MTRTKTRRPLLSAPLTRSTTPADRRRHPRLVGCPPLHVTGLRASVYDVSRTGMCLLLQPGVALGDTFQLTLTDSLDGSTQDVDVEVIWTDAGRAGVSWIGQSVERDRWLFRRFMAWCNALGGTSRR